MIRILNSLQSLTTHSKIFLNYNSIQFYLLITRLDLRSSKTDERIKLQDLSKPALV